MASDVFSVGCVCIEVASFVFIPILVCLTPDIDSKLCTSQAPYAGISDHQVIARVPQGLRPDRPTFLDGSPLPQALWLVMTFCWSTQASHRPAASALAQQTKYLIPPRQRLDVGRPVATDDRRLFSFAGTPDSAQGRTNERNKQLRHNPLLLGSERQSFGLQISNIASPIATPPYDVDRHPGAYTSISIPAPPNAPVQNYFSKNGPHAKVLLLGQSESGERHPLCYSTPSLLVPVFFGMCCY